MPAIKNARNAIADHTAPVRMWLVAIFVQDNLQAAVTHDGTKAWLMDSCLVANKEKTMLARTALYSDCQSFFCGTLLTNTRPHQPLGILLRSDKSWRSENIIWRKLFDHTKSEAAGTNRGRNSSRSCFQGYTRSHSHQIFSLSNFQWVFSCR